MSAQWKKGHRTDSALEAWEQLISAVEGARAFGGTVRERAGDLRDHAADLAGEASQRYGAASQRVGSAYHTASDRVGAVSSEGWKRANLALDALSGRRPRKPWGWIAVAVLGGVALGWAAAAAAPRAIQAAADRLAVAPDEPDDLSATAEPPAAYEPSPPVN